MMVGTVGEALDERLDLLGRERSNGLNGEIPLLQNVAGSLTGLAGVMVFGDTGEDSRGLVTRAELAQPLGDLDDLMKVMIISFALGHND